MQASPSDVGEMMVRVPVKLVQRWGGGCGGWSGTRGWLLPFFLLPPLSPLPLSPQLRWASQDGEGRESQICRGLGVGGVGALLPDLGLARP